MYFNFRKDTESLAKIDKEKMPMIMMSNQHQEAMFGFHKMINKRKFALYNSY